MNRDHAIQAIGNVFRLGEVAKGDIDGRSAVYLLSLTVVMRYLATVATRTAVFYTDNAMVFVVEGCDQPSFLRQGTILIVPSETHIVVDSLPFWCYVGSPGRRRNNSSPQSALLPSSRR